MKQIILMVGPPGAGKTTFAKKYVLEGFTYVNQDSQSKDHLRIFNEALNKGDNIITDRMGFSKAQRNRYLDPAKEKGYETHIIVLHQPYKVCLERCRARKDHETIKDEVSARSALNTFFTKYERPLEGEADTIKFVYPEGDKPLAIVVDLDGTLCNVEHRRHFVRREPGVKKDWQGFFKGMVDDVPNKWCEDILRAMSHKHMIVYCSGRPDNWRKETVEWLKKHNLFSFENGGPNYDFHLYMRPRGDSRDDTIAKEIILDFELLTRFTPYFMIDDRKRVVDMWRSRGYTVLHCDEGEF